MRNVNVACVLGICCRPSWSRCLWGQKELLLEGSCLECFAPHFTHSANPHEVCSRQAGQDEVPELRQLEYS